MNTIVDLLVCGDLLTLLPHVKPGSKVVVTR